MEHPSADHDTDTPTTTTTTKLCRITKLRVSNMTRAIETADIIAKYLPKTVHYESPDPLLNEGRYVYFHSFTHTHTPQEVDNVPLDLMTLACCLCLLLLFLRFPSILVSTISYMSWASPTDRVITFREERFRNESFKPRMKTMLGLNRPFKNTFIVLLLQHFHTHCKRQPPPIHNSQTMAIPGRQPPPPTRTNQTPTPTTIRTQ